ncbi:MAG: FAD-dependent oxidoreductase [Brasilonema octagenarum HA4186-MV1]|nr:FAD-dependent oxidoreductase [Brasilonema octagenarum HA4186-MV1]
MSIEQPNFDVGIIGGGPAGSAIASYLAKAGLKCIVLEREKFPRPHVGESLVPSSTRVFKEIGFLEKMDQAGFPRKYGAVWTAASNSKSPIYQHDWQGLEADCHADVRFEEREQHGVDRNYTYHVDRGKFDLLLLQHAQELGATVCEEVRVKEVDFSEPSQPQIHFSTNKQEMSTSVRVVVDASGRQTLLGNQLKLRIPDPVFNQCAIHTWFEGYDRSTLSKNERQQDYIFVHFLPITNSWVWQIPISETITSIGVVTQRKNFVKSQASREKYFWDCVESRPELLVGLKAAKQLRALKEEGDYSYSMKQICGDGFVLIGDAARFVDPIFSSGVSIALNSARCASIDIIKAAEKGIFTKDSFATYEAILRRGVRNWYEFISLYYRLNVLFTAFIQDSRYRLDIIKLLQGDVYDEEEPEVLRAMRETVTAVEQNKNHLWHQFLGDLKAPSLAPSF